jgi:hypothetical protein
MLRAVVASLTLARPGQEPGVVLVLMLLGVVRSGQKYPRQRWHQHDYQTRRYARFWPSHYSFLQSRPPCAPQRHTPREHSLCQLLQSIRRESRPRAYVWPSHRTVMIMWALRLPCAACMHAAGVRGSADIRFEKLRRLIVRVPAWHGSTGMAWPCASNTLLRLFPGIGSAGVAEKASSRTRTLEALR